MRFGSVCSGIEAASVAWHPLGWQAAWLSEIEPFPSAVLAHHYPDVPNLGDMTALPERILSGEVEAPDLFCGGTPCQAFSVAGLRNSLDDARGNLSLTFVGIANAIDHVRSVRGDDPSIIFYENVPGVLSTKDNAFGCFLGALAGEDDPLIAPGGKWTNAGCVYGPQRAVAWRVLDAQYFGVAQRRRRVFVVASARDGFDPAAVLFEFDGVRRDSAPRREAGQRVAPCVTNGPPLSRTGNERVEAEAMVVQPYERGNCRGIAPTLDANMDRKWGGDQWTNNGFAIIEPIGMSSGQAPVVHGSWWNGDQVTPALTQTLHNQNGRGGHGGADNIGAVMQPIAFHPTQDPISSTEVCHSIGANENATAAVMQPIPLDLRNAGRDPEKHDEMNRQGVGVGTPGEPAHTVTSAFVHGVAQPVAVGTDCYNGLITGDVAATMGTPGSSVNASGPTVMQPVAAMAFTDIGQGQRIRPIDATSETLRATKRGPYSDYYQTSQPMAIGTDCYNGSITGDVSMTLKRGDGNPAINQPTVLQAMQVRRLTPVECERLQGFPDNYTAIPWRKKPASECPDGPRYKALGNSWAVPNVRWIGQRIAEQLKAHP